MNRYDFEFSSFFGNINFGNDYLCNPLFAEKQDYHSLCAALVADVVGVGNCRPFS